MDPCEALGPPPDVVGSWSQELSLEHTLEVVRGVERELEENRLGARVRRDRVEVLRRAAALRHVEKPVTRGEVEGRMLFVSQDYSGARPVRRCAAGSGSARPLADLTATLTVFHLKIGFVRSDRTGYPPRGSPRSSVPSGRGSRA